MTNTIMRGASAEWIDCNDPWETPIKLETIAQSLANICRWGGHCNQFYSVAAHSIHVMSILERTHGKEGARVGLMHDAHEAYTGDCTSPRKQVLGRVWREFENEWEYRVHARFLLPDTDDPIWHDCKQADLVSLATERERLFPPDTEGRWGKLPAPGDEQWVLDHRDPRVVAHDFLKHADRLGIK